MQTYSYREVLQRIKDLTTLVDVSSMEKKLKRLILKAAIDSLSADSLLTQAAVVKIVEGKGEKPCGLVRLLRVRPYKSPGGQYENTGEKYYRTRVPSEPNRLQINTDYDHDSMYIKPSWVRNGHVIISYLGVPMFTYTEDGKEKEEIAISYDQLDYCAYEAIRIVLRDEAVRGNIAYQAYKDFEQESDWKFNVATGNSFQYSIDDMERQSWMLRNGQFFNTK